ncbi:MAG: ADP-ribosylglycohydrolase family protein [Sphaerochaetaceae bacterium]|jgi:type I restriction enzyme M protein|nr:ADP-ribosylglycohydrolase family protein [Sphaerochaetaceae bacterium]HHU88084.1 ADP-ribosylglycohydrolase [Spirochaetales bacterium]
MLGAIVGDIIGSRFEFDNIKKKEFELFSYDCFVTDDSIMTLAIATALLESKEDYSDLSQNAVKYMQLFGSYYPYAGYGGFFAQWLTSDNPQPYGSYGNGAAMRVSGCGFAATTLEEAKALSLAVTEVTHNHKEGLKGAEATAVAVFLAKTGVKKTEIFDYITQNYYPLDFTLDEIRETYQFNETCQETVPQALVAFFEADGFEDAIRNAISIGGDSDTLGAITGAIAEAYYQVPDKIREEALTFLEPQLIEILEEFEARFRD